MSSMAGKVIKCKAAVAWEAGKPLVIEEVEVAPPQKMEVRLKILYTALCHTDVYFWEAKGQTPVFPRIFGHEAGGIVESVGEGVTELAPGDHVLPCSLGNAKNVPTASRRKATCAISFESITDRGVMIGDGQSRFSINGKPIYHFVGTSTFSEYTVIHVGCVAKINPSAPLDKVCVLSCGISTGLGATLNVAKPPKGSTVAVSGWELIAGASKIFGIDLNPNRFEEAKKFCVTDFVNPKDYNKPVQEVLVEMTKGGVDRAVECTEICETRLLLNLRLGTFFGNYKPRTDLPSVVEKYMNKEHIYACFSQLELEKFITHSVPFSEINKAFDYMLKGESIRCIIRMDG
uniref:alcohol dehydrogenase n=1 Tax=Ananas comosus var. bracteatus TaxID=296719 RepID=A0A6V7QH13_ANACO|nr:unnamed protein product [Ananas comosus var. bracteatus]